MKNVILQNLHTHSNYCDGKNTIENTVKKALDLGFDSIGFSSHSTMPHKNSYSMTLDGEKEYKKDLENAKKKYENQIEILSGIEYDLYSINDLDYYDYVIADVHHLKVNNTLVDMDVRTPRKVKEIINEFFDGNAMNYVKCFYETTALLSQLKKADFVGHFDIIEKHVEKEFLFDINSKEYKDLQTFAIENVVNKIPVFEVNTGAISRGYRTTPYPSIFVLKEIKRLGGQITISSDCHDNNYLTHGFIDAINLAKQAGFNEYYVFTKNGFKSVTFDKLLKKL